MSFTRRDDPPKHPITSSICWRWEFEWEAKAFTSPYRVCDCKLASRADLFQYLFANYLGSDGGEDHPDQELRRDLKKNWSLVCFDWAHLCRRRLFAGGAYLHDREDLAAFMEFLQSTSDLPRIIDYLKSLYLRAFSLHILLPFSLLIRVQPRIFAMTRHASTQCHNLNCRLEMGGCRLYPTQSSLLHIRKTSTLRFRLQHLFR